MGMGRYASVLSVLAVAAAMLAVVAGCLPIGGPCFYNETPGTAAIVSVTEIGRAHV